MIKGQQNKQRKQLNKQKNTKYSRKFSPSLYRKKTKKIVGAKNRPGTWGGPGLFAFNCIHNKFMIMTQRMIK